MFLSLKCSNVIMPTSMRALTINIIHPCVVRELNNHVCVCGFFQALYARVWLHQTSYHLIPI